MALSIDFCIFCNEGIVLLWFAFEGHLMEIF